MLRRLIQRAIERIVPKPAPPTVVAPPVAPVIAEPDVPAPKQDSWRASPQRQVAVLNSEMCPEEGCGLPKKMGAYWCNQCSAKLRSKP